MNKFALNEFVVLKPEYNDSNYTRIYKVTEIKEDKISVKIVSEFDNKIKTLSEQINQNELGPYESDLFQTYI